MNSCDLNGNTTRVASTANSEALFATTMNYDTLNRCTEINSPGGIETMAYRGSEWHRYAVTANGVTTNFLYDGDNVVADIESDAIVRYYNTPFLDQNVAMYSVSGEVTTPYYYSQDGLGSVRTVSNSAGAIQNKYDYTAFGEAWAAGTVQNVAQRYTYTSQELEPISGLMYYNYRHYLPAIGRFGQRDPSGERGGINQYAYVANNPSNYTDSSGLFTASNHRIIDHDTTEWNSLNKWCRDQIDKWNDDTDISLFSIPGRHVDNNLSRNGGRVHRQ